MWELKFNKRSSLGLVDLICYLMHNGEHTVNSTLSQILYKVLQTPKSSKTLKKKLCNNLHKHCWQIKHHMKHEILSISLSAVSQNTWLQLKASGFQVIFQNILNAPTDQWLRFPQTGWNVWSLLLDAKPKQADHPSPSGPPSAGRKFLLSEEGGRIVCPSSVSSNRQHVKARQDSNVGPGWQISSRDSWGICYDWMGSTGDHRV